MLTLRASICCTPSWSPSRSPSRRARPASAAFAPRGPRTTPAASRFDRWQTASSAYGGWYQPPPPSAFGRPVPPTTANLIKAAERASVIAEGPPAARKSF